jgi:hypothetical protein
MSTSRIRFLVLGVLLLYPVAYLGMYAGDAQIHLVYGANAAHGAFFEFNRGETSPGVTSPGFMLLLAGLFRVLPAEVVPLAVAAINLVAWYALSATVFLVARRLGLTGTWALACACLAGLLPGSAYNALIGMENGLFALVVAGWIHRALVTGWFDLDQSGAGARSIWPDVWLGACIGASVWLRPEGVVVGALAVTHGVVRGRPAGRSLAFLIPFLLIAGACVAFHYAYTGYLLPTSGAARMLMGSLDALWVGPVPFNVRVIERLLAYLPLTIAWCIGVRVVMRQVAMGPVRMALEFLILLAGVSLALYSTVLGSAHLARYLMFVMPGFVIVAMLGARWLWERRPAGQIAVVLMAAALGTIFAVETRDRIGLASRDELHSVTRAQVERADTSEELFRTLGSPVERPIVIAVVELELRYWLDDRFVVRSLDGRADPVLLQFAGPARFDHVGYIKARGIRYLMEFPNFNRDEDAWSLQSLTTLEPSERRVHDGLVFSLLPDDSGIVRVEPVR